MSNIVLHGSPTETEDIFFGLTPQVTDWDGFFAVVPQTGIDGLLAECHSLEPLEQNDPRDYKMWVLQQKIRAVLRHKKKLPLQAEHTCPTCGTHKADPVLHECVWCAEREFQTGRYGSRGNCEFLKPVFDPQSRSWGLLCYRAFYGSGKNIYMFWLAMGYKTLDAAQMALYPFKLYENWLQRKYRSLYQEWSVEHRLFGISEMMGRKDLPFNPTEFEQESRQRIRQDMTEEHRLSTYYIDSAIRDHNRDEQD